MWLDDSHCFSTFYYFDWLNFFLILVSVQRRVCMIYCCVVCSIWWIRWELVASSDPHLGIAVASAAFSIVHVQVNSLCGCLYVRVCLCVHLCVCTCTLMSVCICLFTCSLYLVWVYARYALLFCGVYLCNMAGHLKDCVNKCSLYGDSWAVIDLWGGTQGLGYL